MIVSIRSPKDTPAEGTLRAGRDGDTDTAAVDRKLPEAPAAAAATLPTSFGEYELLEEIARGGMGVVYKARQVRLDRVVALKMIQEQDASSGEWVRRFHREARAAAAL